MELGRTILDISPHNRSEPDFPISSKEALWSLNVPIHGIGTIIVLKLRRMVLDISLHSHLERNFLMSPLWALWGRASYILIEPRLWGSGRLSWNLKGLYWISVRAVAQSRNFLFHMLWAILYSMRNIQILMDYVCSGFEFSFDIRKHRLMTPKSSGSQRMRTKCEQGEWVE